MLFTDGKVVMPFSDEQSAERAGFNKKLNVDELVSDFIEWYAAPYEHAEYGDKVSELASNYAECISDCLKEYMEIRLTFSRTAINKLWVRIAEAMSNDSRFKKVTTFVYAK